MNDRERQRARFRLFARYLLDEITLDLMTQMVHSAVDSADAIESGLTDASLELDPIKSPEQEIARYCAWVVDTLCGSEAPLGPQGAEQRPRESPARFCVCGTLLTLTCPNLDCEL